MGTRATLRGSASIAVGGLVLILQFGGLGAVALAGPSPQSTTSTIAVTVLDDCRIDSLAWNVAFGTYQMAAPAAVTFAPTLHCTKGATIGSVTLDNGLNYLASSRTMSDGAGHTLPYTLYTNDCGSALNQWTGATTPSTFQNVTSTSVFTAIGGTKCAKIAAGINVPSGSYSDTVTITVNFT
jgi:spore coat protein U-like protein